MSSQPSIFEDTPAIHSAPPSDNYIQPNLGHGLRIWWAFFWRNTIVSLVLSFLFGMAMVLLSRFIPFAIDRTFLIYSGYVLEYIVAIFVVYFIVRKKFRRFRILLTPARVADATQILPPSFRRTFRIWWTYTWRSVVYRVVLGVAMSVPLGVVTGAVTAISPQFGQVFSWITTVVTSGAIGLFTIYSNILDEDIADFRVSLAPRTTVVLPQEVSCIGPAADSAGPAGL